MLYRKMPGINKELSILGFGCMRFPVFDNDPSKIDEQKAEEMLSYAIDQGVNYLDTAYPYHGTGSPEGGSSEPFLGKFLSQGYRDKVLLASKLPSWMITSRDDMDMYLDKQLRRLQTDQIDFYLVHALDINYWSNLQPKGLTDFLDGALDAGKIKHAGFSFHDDSQDLFKGIVDAYDWDFCQIQYNYLDENYQAGKAGLEYAAARGLGIVIMEPLKGGSLAMKLPEEATKVLADIDPGRKPVDWALSWLWDHPDIHVVLSGMSTLEQVVENIEIADRSTPGCLSDFEKEAIDRVKNIMHNKVKVDCTACGYCMPCPEGIDIPRNFLYYNNYHRFDDVQTRNNSRIMYNKVLSEEEKGSNCVECGTCEPLCPQNIDIIAKLKEVADVMEQSR